MTDDELNAAVATKSGRWKAYRCVAIDTVCIVAARKRSDAIAQVVRAANEVAYGVRWNDVTALRAKEFDSWAAASSANRCWTEEYVRKATKGAETK